MKRFIVVITVFTFATIVQSAKAEPINQEEAIAIAHEYMSQYTKPAGVEDANMQVDARLYELVEPESSYRVYFFSEFEFTHIQGDACQFNVIVSSKTGRILPKIISNEQYLDIDWTFDGWGCYFDDNGFGGGV